MWRQENVNDLIYILLLLYVHVQDKNVLDVIGVIFVRCDLKDLF